jgi:6-pyruvoyltetrahydropterin/6-carboxytetrahydropterin synthase
MPETYCVRIAKERLVFSAGHFITYGGDTCEPLHGHNYHVRCELEGPLNGNQYVVDFIALRDALESLTAQLDHRMLLPTEHPTIHVRAVPRAEGNEVEVTHERRRWVFPAEDCVLLPVANTTAELLARHLAQQLRSGFLENRQIPWTRLRLEVDECDGQWARYEVTRTA